jgi:hypothetical protein
MERCQPEFCAWRRRIDLRRDMVWILAFHSADGEDYFDLPGKNPADEEIFC